MGRPDQRRTRQAAAWVAGLFALACACAVAAPDADVGTLANMSLEELMNTPVTTVAGQPSSRMGTPAAVTVITAEDIRRNGFRSVAEALRLVPGMFVGRVNSSSWVIGARGLTGSALTASRYLVLIDGRRVYDPLTSVTFWDTVDVVLADVDRIEVIRGPGATLWGVNAMNGVINIITRRARETLGTLVQLGAGNEGERTATARYGAAIDSDTAFRVFGQYAGHGSFDGPDGRSLHDEWSNLHAGFRLDGQLTQEAGYTLQGDAYTHPTSMESVQLPVPGLDREFRQVTVDDTVRGANVLFRAMSGFENDDGWMFRTYLDQTRRDTSRFGVDRETFDAEYRNWLRWSGRNQLIWGVEVERTRDDVANGPVLFLTPASRAWNVANAFVQDTVDVVPDSVFLMLGTKLTEHSFAGFQIQPSVRLWWTPSPDQTLWMAASRPVRVPSRIEEDGLLVFSYIDSGVLAGGSPSGTIVPLGLAGSEDLRPEKLRAWELGHRIRLSDEWLFDTTLFYNDYQRLIGVPPGIYGHFSDASSGRTYGMELSVSARLTSHWRMEGSWSRLETRINGPVLPFEEISTPRTLAQLHSYVDIGERVQLQGGLYRVGEIPWLHNPAYTRTDLGLTWRVRSGVDLSLWGQNLFDAGHPEASGALVPRTLYAQVSFQLGR
jgi:iron complex outermembrane recepter protein